MVVATVVVDEFGYTLAWFVLVKGFSWSVVEFFSDRVEVGFGKLV